MRWIQGLVKEVESIPDTALVGPEREIGASDKVIGEISLPTRRLYTYCDLLVLRIKVLDKQVEATDSKRETTEIKRQIKTLSERYDVARAVLWQEVRHEFQEQIKGDDNIGVRKGWQVVIIESLSLLAQILKSE